MKCCGCLDNIDIYAFEHDLGLVCLKCNDLTDKEFNTKRDSKIHKIKNNIFFLNKELEYLKYKEEKQ